MAPAPRRTTRRKSRTARPSACCATSNGDRSSRDERNDACAAHACYTKEVIDTHVHLDADQYPDPSGAIKRARDAGVSAIVVPGVGPASNRSVIELGRKFRGVIFPALGFHPERFEHSEDDAREVLEMIERERDSICAIGEVGLPWYGERASAAGVLDAAKVTLARFARAAVALDLPLILHAPHARAAEALAIIREAGVMRAVFHWHKSDEQTHASDPQRRIFYFADARSRLQAARSGSRADASP